MKKWLALFAITSALSADVHMQAPETWDPVIREDGSTVFFGQYENKNSVSSLDIFNGDFGSITLFDNNGNIKAYTPNYQLVPGSNYILNEFPDSFIFSSNEGQFILYKPIPDTTITQEIDLLDE